MRNGPHLSAAAPPRRAGRSLLRALALESAPPLVPHDPESRLANDIAELISRRPRPSAHEALRPPLPTDIGRLPIPDPERVALRNAAFPRPSQSRPAAPLDPAHIMPGLRQIREAAAVPPRYQPGGWVRKRRRSRVLEGVRTAASWLTAVAIGGGIIAVSAIVLGAPRDLDGYVRLFANLFKA